VQLDRHNDETKVQLDMHSDETKVQLDRHSDDRGEEWQSVVSHVNEPYLDQQTQHLVDTTGAADDAGCVSFRTLIPEHISFIRHARISRSAKSRGRYASHSYVTRLIDM